MRAVDRGLADWRPLLAPAVEPLLAAARAHEGTLEEFSARLPELFGRMDDGAAAELLRDLMFSGRISAGADG